MNSVLKHELILPYYILIQSTGVCLPVLTSLTSNHGRSGKLGLAPARRCPESVPGHPNHTFHLHHLQRVKSIYGWRDRRAMRAGAVPPARCQAKNVRAGRPGEPRPVFAQAGSLPKRAMSIKPLKICLTHKALITTAADDKFCDIFPDFRRDKT